MDNCFRDNIQCTDFPTVDTTLSSNLIDQIYFTSTNEDLKTELASREDKTPSTKPSRAARKREKRANQRKLEETAVAKAAASSVNTQRAKEFQNISAQLATRDLKLFEVPSDGDCLYLSIAHQLSHQHSTMDRLFQNLDQISPSPLDKDNPKSISRYLRLLAAHYLRTHMDDFSPFMFNSKTGEPMSSDEFNTYCNAVEKPSTWGGQIEIQALSNALKVPIEVLQAEGPIIVINEDLQAPPITITYHRHAFALGEHYNSCLPTKMDLPT